MNYSKTSKQLFRLLSLTLLVAVTTACSTDDVLLDTPAAARGIPFTATISNGITRVTAKKGTTADGIYTGQVPLGLGHSDQGSNGSVTIGSQTLTYQQQRNEGGLPTFLRFNVVGSSWDDYSWRTITIAPRTCSPRRRQGAAFV